MKKSLSLLVISIVFMGSIMQAQVLTSKKGIPILPVAGDFALGISATPLLDFAGNLIKINSNNTFSSDASWNYTGQDQAIYAKYFLTDNTAIRARLRINKTAKKETAYSIQNQTATINPYLIVEDSWIHSTTNVILSCGFEKRRGYGRLQGFYGAELTLALTGASKDKFSYGNSIDSVFVYPDRTDFIGNVQGNHYLTESKTKAIFGFGIGAFAGAEYFVLPKISIGGEFGWSIGMNQSNSHGEETKDWEYWGITPGSPPSSSAAVQSVTVKNGMTSFLNVGNSQTAGNLFLLLHF